MKCERPGCTDKTIGVIIVDGQSEAVCLGHYQAACFDTADMPVPDHVTARLDKYKDAS